MTAVALSPARARAVRPFVRVPTVARWIRGSVPQVYRPHIPEEHIRRCYPEELAAAGPVVLIAS